MPTAMLLLEPAKRPITIRDITRHTAGFAGMEIPALAELVRKADYGNPANTLADMSKKLASLCRYNFIPAISGRMGLCVDVQAYLVEKLLGKTIRPVRKRNHFRSIKNDEHPVCSSRKRPCTVLQLYMTVVMIKR